MASSQQSKKLFNLIIRFLNSKNIEFEQVYEKLNDTTTNQLVPAFFLVFTWLAANVKEPGDLDLNKSQAAINLFSIFSMRIPVFILLLSSEKQNFGFNQPTSYLIKKLNDSLFPRMMKFVSIIHPIELTIASYTSEALFFKRDDHLGHDSRFRFIFETEPRNHELFIEKAQKMLVSHVPIEFFSSINDLQNGKYILTRALISLFDKLNQSRKATHSQLIYMFSTLFQYVTAFAENDKIDGQIFCEHLQSTHYMSPFCLLGFINHITHDLYMYNLIVPAKIVRKSDNYKEAYDELAKQYLMVDFSFDNSLNQLISNVHNMTLSYIYSDLSFGKLNGRPKTDSEIIIFIHQCGTTLAERMKEVLVLASNGIINELHVAAMDTPLLKMITFSLMKGLKEMVISGVFTKNLYDFLILVLATLIPSYGEKFAKKFYSLPITDYLAAEILIRAVASHNLSMFIPMQKHIIPFAFECLKHNTGNVRRYARYLIFRFYFSYSVELNDEVFGIIKECKDVFTLINTIYYIDCMKMMQTNDEYLRAAELRTFIINKKLPFRLSNPNDKPFYYEGINEQMCNDLNDVSKKAVQLAVKKDLTTNPLLSIGIMANSAELKTNRMLAYQISKIVAENLKDMSDSSDVKCPFIITNAEILAPHAMLLFFRLTIYGYEEEALLVLKSLAVFAKKDDLLLNWMTPLLRNSYNFLTQRLKESLADVVMTYPDSKKYFITGNNMANEVTKIFAQKEMALFQEPTNVYRACVSMNGYIFKFVAPAFILSTPNEDALVDLLLSPILDIKNVWINRERQCCYISFVAVAMPRSICTKFFARLIAMYDCELALDTARSFVIFSELGFYQQICRSSFEIIANNDKKLEAFIYITAPSYNKLKNDEETATEYLAGLLKSVKSNSKKCLLDLVIDVVGFIYMRLKLVKSRAVLINASSRFPPELRGIIASSLELDIVT